METNASSSFAVYICGGGPCALASLQLVRPPLEPPKQWKIGALFAFSGPLAFLGQDTFLGAEIASQIINERGGINGAPIAWEKADAGTPADARSEAERLADSGVKVVFGTNSSGLAMTASQALEQRKVIFWEPGSAAEEITTRGFQYTFRTVPPGSQWAYTLADFAVEDWRRLSARPRTTFASRSSTRTAPSAIPSISLWSIGCIRKTFRSSPTSSIPRALPIFRHWC